jgi:hypothetical protein
VINIILDDLFAKCWDVLGRYEPIGPIYMCQTESEARDFVASQIAQLPTMSPGYKLSFNLYLDNELKPGCGSGLGFLKHMLADYNEFIERVIPITNSPDAQKEMLALCKQNTIPYGAVK